MLYISLSFGTQFWVSSVGSSCPVSSFGHLQRCDFWTYIFNCYHDNPLIVHLYSNFRVYKKAKLINLRKMKGWDGQDGSTRASDEIKKRTNKSVAR